MTIPIAVYTELILLMMSSKPARNMYRLIIEINEYKIVHLVGSYYTVTVLSFTRCQKHQYSMIRFMTGTYKVYEQ